MSNPVERPSLSRLLFNALFQNKLKNAQGSLHQQCSLPSRPPTTRDPDLWRTHWELLGQPWRTEPEIDTQQQEYLAQRRTIVPDVEQGSYPFRNIKLSRADIEWLLATHEQGQGPVKWQDELQRERNGLDLRGADLQNVKLDGLPLARMIGGPTTDNMLKAYREAGLGAAVWLNKATLRDTSLEGAQLSYAHLEKVSLVQAHLDYADLSHTHLERAWLDYATLTNANLQGDHAEGASICGIEASHMNAENAFLEGVFGEAADLTWANVMGSHLEYATLNKAMCHHADFSRTHLCGTSFQDAHLEGTNMSRACLRGRQLSSTALDRIRRWYTGKLWDNMPMEEWEEASQEIFPDHPPAANLAGAFFDTATRLNEADFGDVQDGSPKIVDIHWNDVNLSVVDWSVVKLLGDEQQARAMLKGEQQEKIATVIDTTIDAALRANRQFVVCPIKRCFSAR